MPTSREAQVEYEPACSTIEDFHASPSLVRGLMGARGTAKSGACIAEGYGAACEQTPSWDGKRRSKFLVLRDTYRQLETTTIPSFMKWLGKNGMTHLKGTYPIHAYTRCEAPGGDGTRIEMETVFLAMDGENIIDNLQSFEASFAWINEARAIESQNIVNMVLSSTGRFPSKDEEGCKRRFVAMDTNPPDEFHWWYKSNVESTPEGWEFFIQEPPLIYTPPQPGMITYVPDKAYYKPNPRATYATVQNEGYGYWLDLIPGSTDAFIRTMVMGKFGTIVAGKPVYGQWWNEDVIAPKPIPVVEALPVLVGIDTSGLHPGAVFTQASGGVVNALDECHAMHLPFDEYVEAILVPKINERFRQNQIIATVDPSNPRASIGGKTAIQILNGWGIQAELASTNRFNARLGAVVRLLQRRRALSIDRRCTMLIQGFRGKYAYPKIESSLIEAYKPMPEKNEFADIHDGFQYAALYYQRGAERGNIQPVPPKRIMYA